MLREPANWRVSLLLFLVILFSLVSGVILSAGGGGPPEEGLAIVLGATASRVVSNAYPFVFPLVAVLVTLALVAQREGGGLASLQALGFRRWEVYSASSIGVLVLAMAPAIVAFLLLPVFLEPRLVAQGNFLALYPGRYWLAIPRLLLATLFIGLFATAFAIFLPRPAVAFGAMITFFFIGWYLVLPLGVYGILAPPLAFQVAYKPDFLPLEGIPFAIGDTYLLYLAVAFLSFGVALLYASRRGELR